MILTDALKKDIKILKYNLKDEDLVKEILKKRLTKKEYKLYFMKNNNSLQDNICQELNIDNKRYDEIYETVIKKINYEKLKNELSDK